ncbi:hypothetical protein KEJ47_09930 [Candidatus Bathyarchaeota archaeon]|nr:hypothetical protein [Candidatus Bathyarchaeota archaeon]
MSFRNCPGVSGLIGPAKITTRNCPACGEEVEFFSDETATRCPGCGRLVHQEPSPTCISWCDFADKCLTDLQEGGRIPPSRAEELRRMLKKKADTKKTYTTGLPQY